MIAGDVHKALVAASIPIEGVSIGRANDKKTWRIDWPAKPSAQQEAAAQAVLDAFDVAAEAAKPPPKSDVEKLADRIAALEASAAAPKAAQAKP